MAPCSWDLGRVKLHASSPTIHSYATKRQIVNVGTDLWSATIAGRGFWSPFGGRLPHSNVQSPGPSNYRGVGRPSDPNNRFSGFSTSGNTKRRLRTPSVCVSASACFLPPEGGTPNKLRMHASPEWTHLSMPGTGRSLRLLCRVVPPHGLFSQAIQQWQNDERGKRFRQKSWLAKG